MRAFPRNIQCTYLSADMSANIRQSGSFLPQWIPLFGLGLYYEIIHMAVVAMTFVVAFTICVDPAPNGPRSLFFLTHFMVACLTTRSIRETTTPLMAFQVVRAKRQTSQADLPDCIKNTEKLEETIDCFLMHTLVLAVLSFERVVRTSGYYFGFARFTVFDFLNWLWYMQMCSCWGLEYVFFGNPLEQALREPTPRKTSNTTDDDGRKTEEDKDTSDTTEAG